MRRVLQAIVFVVVLIVSLAAFARTAGGAPTDVACGTSVEVPYRNVESLSDTGLVGGANWRNKPLIWDSTNGTTQWLGSVQDNLPAQVMDVSLDGTQVVGFGFVPSTAAPSGQVEVAWRREADRLKPIPTPYGFRSVLLRVNGDGVAVGELDKVEAQVSEETYYPRPFVVPHDGVRQNLLLPAPITFANVLDLSPSGRVLARISHDGPMRPLVWTDYGAYPKWGPRGLWPYAFVGSDQVVGTKDLDRRRVYTWNVDSNVVTELPIVGTNPTPVEANGNVIVGAGGAGNTAWRWDPVGGQQRLDFPGVTTAAPVRINARGQVLAWAYAADGSRHTYLWTPCGSLPA